MIYPGPGKTMSTRCMTGKVKFFMSLFLKLLRAKVQDLAQEVSQKINNA